VIGDELGNQRVVEARAALGRGDELHHAVVLDEADRPEQQRRDMLARMAPCRMRIEIGQRPDREPDDVLPIGERLAAQAAQAAQRGQLRLVGPHREPAASDQREHEANRITGDRNSVVRKVEQAVSPLE